MKRMIVIAAPILLALLSAAELPAQKQMTCCCTSPSGAPVGVPATAGFPEKDVCPLACSSNGVTWHAQTANSCKSGQTVGTEKSKIMPSIDERVTESIQWSIGHQGARVFLDEGDGLLKGEALKNAVIAPMHPGTDRDHVSEAYTRNGNDLTSYVKEALNRCKAARPKETVIEDMYFVCYHEGNSYKVRHNTEDRHYDEVRSVFSNAERHDDKIRNTLYCYNATEIMEIERRGCPAKPR